MSEIEKIVFTFIVILQRFHSHSNRAYYRNLLSEPSSGRRRGPEGLAADKEKQMRFGGLVLQVGQKWQQPSTSVTSRSPFGSSPGGRGFSSSEVIG